MLRCYLIHGMLLLTTTAENGGYFEMPKMAYKEAEYRTVLRTTESPKLLDFLRYEFSGSSQYKNCLNVSVIF